MHVGSQFSTRNGRRRGTAALVLAVTLLLSGCTVSTDWMSRLFDQTHGGHTTDNNLNASGVSTLNQKWRFVPPACVGGGSPGVSWYATPVTFKGVIYIGSDNGCLYAIDEATGTQKWVKTAAYISGTTCTQPLGIVSSVRVVDDGNGNPLLYFHSPDGYLYKLDGNGNQIWRSLVQIPSTTQNDVYAWSSPTVANGKVIIGVSSNCDHPFVQGKVIAYDANTGNPLWTHKTIPDGFVGAGDWYDAAVDENGDVYVSTGSTTDAIAQAHPNNTEGFEQYSILKLNGTSGSLIWKAPAPAYLNDPDYATSPVLFEGGGLKLVGATNKDGWFRVYRRDTGQEMWQAQVGTQVAGASAALSGGAVWDQTRSQLLVMSNATTTGGSWVQYPPGAWTEQGGTSAAGSIRRLDPATGALVTVGGAPFELALPANALAPCSINDNGLLVCAGGHLVGVDLTAHDNGVYVVDTTQRAAVLRHLEDTKNYGEFSQPVQENGAILAANLNALTKWAP